MILDDLNFDVNEMVGRHQDHVVNLNNDQQVVYVEIINAIHHIVNLNSDQQVVYVQIINAVHHGSGGFFFVYRYCGTGKTFI